MSIMGSAGPPPSTAGAIAVVVHFPDEVLYPSEFLWPGGDVVNSISTLPTPQTGSVANLTVSAVGGMPPVDSFLGSNNVPTASIIGTVT